MRNVHDSYLYSWRSFTNPANSSYNNAYELGNRTWNKEGKFGQRRAMMEEAQEVKAFLKVSKNGTDSLYVGQAALDTIRQNSDLYRQLASRYILIGHSMGGVASREYVQGMGYNFDVDKVVTLDSPHEGTGALNLLLYLKDVDYEQLVKNWVTETIAMEGFAVAAYLMGLDALSADLALLGIFMPTRWG